MQKTMMMHVKRRLQLRIILEITEGLQNKPKQRGWNQINLQIKIESISKTSPRRCFFNGRRLSVSRAAGGLIDNANTFIPYDDAINHLGSDSPYGGYVVSWSSPGVNGDPLFINIGADYPDTSRLTVVIWGENRDDTTEDIVDSLLGKEVVAFGSPYEYNGAAQIEIMDPSELLTYEEFQELRANQ